MQLITLIATLPLFLSGAYASPFDPIEKRLPPAGTSCGVVGYDRGHFILNKRQCSLSECATLCVKNSQCRSYGYGEKTCRLYSSLVKDNVDCKKRSPYIFYDKACKAPIGPKITTTSKATTTTTKSCTTTTKLISTTTSRLVISTTRSTSASTTAKTSSSTTSAATSASTTAKTSTSSSLSSTSSSTPAITTSMTTTTTTVSTTTTALACPSNKPFAILSLRNTASADGTPDNGTPATLPQEDITNGPRTGPDYLLFSTSSGLATFTLDSSCHLVSSKSDRPATIFTNDPGLQRVSFDANVGVPGQRA
ncbi:unnamed protein product [Zymoseptoria tritici ST99CH_3D7]|uniref:Apple domain-containing protein n=1 Tax=Zymoseptoria tritici (strain ST99CH_3D7) TaxID=1276538 RepID=A0A1X7RID6_ZYMT9|nr:unnamed protein product [Zymoseptoria tritici ST99CH_3D7]